MATMSPMQNLSTRYLLGGFILVAALGNARADCELPFAPKEIRAKMLAFHYRHHNSAQLRPLQRRDMPLQPRPQITVRTAGQQPHLAELPQIPAGRP